MAEPWRGAARPMTPGAFDALGAALDVEPDVIRAVWEVESSGQPFEADGTLTRRFEPHHFPARHHAAIGWHGGGWRDALKIGKAARRRMFEAGYRIAPEAALRAASFGGPQIMGFNAVALGYVSADHMVRLMADGENKQLDAFARFVKLNGLVTHLRAHDWHAFAAGYNGSGQAAVYARKIETAWRRISGGGRSAVVLRDGSEGAEVRRLQDALLALGHRPVGILGTFNADTAAAVRAFQERAGLRVDGIVGARTWAALEAALAAKGREPVAPPAQEDRLDKGLQRVRDVAGTVTAASTASAPFWDRLTELQQTILIVGAVATAVVAVGAYAVFRLRRAR